MSNSHSDHWNITWNTGLASAGRAVGDRAGVGEGRVGLVGLEGGGGLDFGELVLGDVGGVVAAAKVAVGAHRGPAEAVDGLLVDDEVHRDDLGLAGHDGDLDDLAADPDLDGSALGVCELVKKARFKGLVGSVVGVDILAGVLGPAARCCLLLVVGLFGAATNQGKDWLEHLNKTKNKYVSLEVFEGKVFQYRNTSLEQSAHRRRHVPF